MRQTGKEGGTIPSLKELLRASNNLEQTIHHGAETSQEKEASLLQLMASFERWNHPDFEPFVTPFIVFTRNSIEKVVAFNIPAVIVDRNDVKTKERFNLQSPEDLQTLYRTISFYPIVTRDRFFALSEKSDYLSDEKIAGLQDIRKKRIYPHNGFISYLNSDSYKSNVRKPTFESEEYFKDGRYQISFKWSWEDNSVDTAKELDTNAAFSAITQIQDVIRGQITENTIEDTNIISKAKSLIKNISPKAKKKR